MKKLGMIFLSAVVVGRLSAQWGCGEGGLLTELVYPMPTTGGVGWAVSDSLDPAAGRLLVGVVFEEGDIRFSNTDGPSGRLDRRRLCPSRNWGIRVGGQYDLCDGCSYAQLFGRFVHFQDGATLRGNLLPLLPFVFDGSVKLGLVDLIPPFSWDSSLVDQDAFLFVDGVAKGCLRTNYWDVDFRVGRHFCRCVDLQLLGGLRYVDICERVNAEFSGGSLVTVDVTILDPNSGSPMASACVDFVSRWLRQSQRRQFWGLGPEIGIAGEWSLNCHLYLRGEGVLIAAIGSQRGDATAKAREHLMAEALGESESLMDQFDLVYDQRFSEDNCLLVAPGIDLRVAVGHSLSCNCRQATLELGYLLTHYWNVLPIGPTTSPSAATSNGALPSDFGFSGPYLGLTVTY